MNILSRLAALLALLAVLILGYLLLFKQGGCDRDDVPDEDPEPACSRGTLRLRDWSAHIANT